MTEEDKKELSEDEAILKLALAMKDNATTTDNKNNVHIFLHNIAVSDDTTKTGNLRVDKETDELGIPAYTVRGAKEMALISEKIMDNDFFKGYFEKDAENTLSTSLSREGFLVKQATTTTKAIADITKRRKTNRGWFGTKKTVEESGGNNINSN